MEAPERNKKTKNVLFMIEKETNRKKIHRPNRRGRKFK
jgi:hypothetical protein